MEMNVTHLHVFSLFYCSVFHRWILRSCPGRSRLDIRNAQRLFLFHNDSGQRYPNCPQLPRWDILSTVMRASPCLTVTERAGDGGLYRALEFCSVLSQPDVSVHPASYTPGRWWMDAQTNGRQSTHSTRSGHSFSQQGPLNRHEYVCRAWFHQIPCTIPSSNKIFCHFVTSRWNYSENLWSCVLLRTLSVLP